MTRILRLISSKAIVVSILSLFVFLIPPEQLPWENGNTLQVRTLAIFILAVGFWITEAIPAYATSILIIVLLQLFVGDRGILALRLENALAYQDIFSSFGAGIIMLFIGGFLLANAAEKAQLSVIMARKFLRPFGQKTFSVLAGIMIISAILSMFLSNTATTALMLTVFQPLLRSFPKTSRLRIIFPIAIAFSANIGGIGTPVGTPPNAIGLNALAEYGLAIPFGVWVLFALPYVIAMLAIMWLYFFILYPSKIKKLDFHLQSSDDVEITPEVKRMQIKVSVIMGMTILFWLTDKLHGIHSYIVAIGAVGALVLAKIINEKDISNINWDVIWLMAGGLALGSAIPKTGLANSLISLIPKNMGSGMLYLVLFAIFMYLMSNFMSHTAAANFILPLAVVLFSSISGSTNMDMLGSLLTITFASSISMILPVSTPPNALAYGTHLFSGIHMLKAGLVIGIIGLLIAIFYLKAINPLIFSLL